MVKGPTWGTPEPQGVLNDIDTDPEGQVMMVEQFIAEARGVGFWE